MGCCCGPWKNRRSKMQIDSVAADGGALYISIEHGLKPVVESRRPNNSIVALGKTNRGDSSLPGC